ncbi:MAG: DUF4007 family protein [Lachnospiraceae bacterium]|nr:DUF4007 family protein [Lachnospiraceae bacterium]
MIEKKIKIKLQGHEKFALREGWLNKGIMMLEKNPKVFQEKDAPDIFGMGSNMVKSLRHWLRAYGLLDEKKGGLTDIGKVILKYDKYFEDLFTIWILHSNIAKNVDEATTWYMFFNRCNLEEFGKDEIIECLKREIFKYTNGVPFSEQSLKNDVDVLLSMYGKEKGMTDPEDKNISPMAQLELIRKVDGIYIKNHPDRRKINEWDVLYELGFLMKDKKFISIDSVSIGEKSISSIYQIPRVTVNELLEKLNDLGYIRLDRTAGLDMIYKVMNITPEEVAESYYKLYR